MDKRPGPNATSLTEAAFFAALTVIFCVMGSYLPFLGIVINLIVPVPVIILTMRAGFRVGTISTIVAGLLVGVLVGPSQMIVVILGFGFLGIAIGGALREGFSPGRVMMIGSVVSFTSKLLLMMVLIWVFKIPISNGSEDLIAEGMVKAEELYRSMGLSEAEIANSVKTLKTMMAGLALLFPAILIMTSVADTFINLGVARVVGKKLGQEIGWFPPFAEWKLPWQFIWGYLLGLMLTIVGNFLSVHWVYAVGMNIYYLFMYVFLIEGMAVTWYGLREWKVTPVLKWSVLLLAFLIPPVIQVLHWVGILDLWFDFRRFFKRKSDGGDMG